MKILILRSLIFYKKYVSKNLEILFGSACRFKPTCSEYAHKAISAYGVKKGGVLAIKRIIKCHPFSKPGYDPLKSL